MIDHLRRCSANPDGCWFCLWDGYGWTADAIPDTVENGPRVRLPDRDYHLYRGPAEAAIVGYPGEPLDHTANLWWPEDHTWCVASEIDLSSTYVGGPAELVSALVGDTAIEALEVESDFPAFRTEPWVERWVSDAVDALSNEGHALVSTPVGTVEAWLHRPVPFRRGSLLTRSHSILGHDGSATHFTGTSKESAARLRETLSFYLRIDIIALVGE